MLRTLPTPHLHRPLVIMTIAAALVIFAASCARHLLFHSSAWDLTIFDQGLYLLSQGKPAVETIGNLHIIADHGAMIHFATAVLYWIYPSVYWLFGLQAVALALGAIPIWHLTRDAGLSIRHANLMALVYLAYPLVFNQAVSDYHPEAIGVPALLAAALAARRGSLLWFCLALALVLSVKEVLAWTVVGMGLWLLVFEKCRRAGVIAVVAGVGWFLVDTMLIMPHFHDGSVPIGRHLTRYAYLGNSLADILFNIWHDPARLIGGILNADNLFYLVLLAAPVAWGLSPRHLTPLVAASPMLAMNMIADPLQHKNIVYQYALPILPFLMLCVISALAAGRVWTANRAFVLCWSLAGFLALGKAPFFTSIYLDDLSSWRATRTAIAMVPPEVPVFTIQHIAPHLSHRPVIRIAESQGNPDYLSQADYVLIDVARPGSVNTEEEVSALVKGVQADPKFRNIMAQDGVFLFRRIGVD